MLRLFEPRERREAYALLPAIIFVALVETAGVASIAPFLALVASPSSVDTIPLLKNVYDALGFTSEQAFLIFVGSASLVAIIVSNAFSALVRYLIYRFAYLQSHRLQNRLLRHYMSQPYAAFLGRNSSELGKNIIIEVSEAVNRVLLPLLQGASKLFAVTAIIVLLVIVNPLLALTVAVALGGTYALIYAGMRKRLQRTGDERVALERIRYQTMAEGFGGLKEVQAGGHERHILEAFFLPSLRHARITIAQRTIGAMPKYLLEVVAYSGIMGIVLFMLIRSGDLATVLPVLGLYAFASFRLMPGLQLVFESAAQIRYSGAAVDVLAQELASAQDDAEVPDAARPEPIPLEHAIELRDVTFRYPARESAGLSHVTMRFPAGARIGLVGPTGCGKSTTLDLVLGLLKPSQGRVLIDDRVLSESDWRAWRANIGYVPQSIFLVDNTIARNIAFGVPDGAVDMDRVRQVAGIAQIGSFIESLPEGYGTIVGDRGVRLSGGQRQRLGIARALYRDPQVLILDEATSALDHRTEAAFHRALDRAARDKTIIMVAHRLSTVRDCDKLFLLDQGRLLAEGTFGHLMSTHPDFLRLTDDIPPEPVSAYSLHG